jgi:hypothetical protein
MAEDTECDDFGGLERLEDHHPDCVHRRTVVPSDTLCPCVDLREAIAHKNELADKLRKTRERHEEKRADLREAYRDNLRVKSDRIRRVCETNRAMSRVLQRLYDASPEARAILDDAGIGPGA